MLCSAAMAVCGEGVTFDISLVFNRDMDGGGGGGQGGAGVYRGVMGDAAWVPSIVRPLYTGLGRGPYGGRHLGSCPPSGPQFQARGWTSTTLAHCKLTNFIIILAYDCFRNPSSTKLNIFLNFCLHNVLLIFS